MAKTDVTSSSSSNKEIDCSALPRSQPAPLSNESLSGATEAGKSSFIKQAALDEGRKEAWQEARGFVSAASSSAGSVRQTCNTEHYDDWLKHRTFAALKVEIDDSPLVSCLRHSDNVNVSPSVGSVPSASEDCKLVSSSSGECNTGERSRKVDEASVSSFEYRQITPLPKDLSQNVWQELKVVRSCDSSRHGSVMDSALQHQQPSSSAKASSMSSFQIAPRSHNPQSPAKSSCSQHYHAKILPSSSLPTSDSDASEDRKHLAARLSKLNNRLKGGGVGIDVSDSSAQTDVAGMKLLIERQRQSYIRRLKREIQWLEKVEKLLLEAQGRKRDSAFAKRATEIALRPVGIHAEDRGCQACHEVNPETVGELLEQSAAVYNSPLFVRCDFMRKFQDGEDNENVHPGSRAKRHQIAPRDLLKDGYYRILGADSSNLQYVNDKVCPNNGATDTCHQTTPIQPMHQNQKSVHYSDNVNNHTVTLSYQQLTNSETTVEPGMSAENVNSKSSVVGRPVSNSATSNGVELTSTPYPCQTCRHHCPFTLKLSGIPADSVRKIRSKSRTSPSWLQPSTQSASFSDNKADDHPDQERSFVSIPVTTSPRHSENKILPRATVKKPRASPKNMTIAAPMRANSQLDAPADKPKIIRTQRLSRSGIAWYVPVHDAKPWLHHRGRGDGSIAEVELVPGQNDMNNGLARSADELTLQDAFRCFKSAFIQKSQARVKKVKIAARQRRHRIQSRAIALNRNRHFMATIKSDFADQLHRPCKRSFSHQEMRIQTERMYRTLPEFQEQIDAKRRKEVYRTNKLMAELYKARVLQRTLRGKVSYAITEKLL